MTKSIKQSQSSKKNLPTNEETQETKEFCAQSTNKRKEIGQRWVDYCVNLSNDSDLDYRQSLRVYKWFEKQGMTKGKLQYWREHDEEFNELFERGHTLYCEWKYAGVELGDLTYQAPIMYLAQYSQEHKSMLKTYNAIKAESEAQAEKRGTIIVQLPELKAESNE